MDPVGALGMFLSSYNNSTVKLPADISKKKAAFLIILMTPYIFLVFQTLSSTLYKTFRFKLSILKNAFQELFLNCSNLGVCSCLLSTKLQHSILTN